VGDSCGFWALTLLHFQCRPLSKKGPFLCPENQDHFTPKFIMGGSDEEKFDHPTQKPLELMRRPILNHTKRGEAVYDPFLGSGTTLMAAELTERICYGVELDPKYCDVILQRWGEFSGRQATLEADGRTFAQVKAERVGIAA
jgi:DNA modification methylase